jgi:hypothetical protein
LFCSNNQSNNLAESNSHNHDENNIAAHNQNTTTPSHDDDDYLNDIEMENGHCANGELPSIYPPVQWVVQQNCMFLGLKNGVNSALGNDLLDGDEDMGKFQRKKANLQPF